MKLQERVDSILSQLNKVECLRRRRPARRNVDQVFRVDYWERGRLDLHYHIYGGKGREIQIERKGERMNGLLIFPDDSGWPFASPFAACFEPILDDLGSLYWLAQNYDSGPFDYALASERYDGEFLDELFVDIPNERDNVEIGCQLLRPGFLPALATHIYQDSIELVGLAGDEVAATSAVGRFLKVYWEEWRDPRRVDRRFYHDLLESSTEICFFCREGAAWEMYGKDRGVIESVAQHIAATAGLRGEPRELSERDKRDRSGRPLKSSLRKAPPSTR